MIDSQSKSQRLAQALLAVMGFAFLVSGLVYLYGGRWTVTAQDYWIIYNTCLEHSWLESALLKVNHQPLFFPSLIWLADLRFFHGNQELLFYIGLALLCGTVLLMAVPFWRAKDLSRTTKLQASVALIVGNFWMARAPITTSGGFNCICSLALGGAIIAILCLHRARADAKQLYLPIIAGAFLASFSFGTGLAIWPTLLLLAWSMRLPWRALITIAAAGIGAAVIYYLLPGPNGVPGNSPEATSWLMQMGVMLRNLCLLLGSPFLHGQAAWTANTLASEGAATSLFCLVYGAVGLACAGFAILPRIFRRDLPPSASHLTAVGLVIFNLIAMVLIVLGRSVKFQLSPSGFLSPRYLFWSTLFWTGLMLVLILAAPRRKGLQWPVLVLTLSLPILTFPLHYREGAHWRYAQFLLERASIGLINDVRDAKAVRILFRKPAYVYALASRLREQRLDMFAAGFHEWIGQPQTQIWDGRQSEQNFRAECAVEDLIQDADGNPAARVVGSSFKNETAIPATLVFVNDAGVVCGVGRSWTNHDVINRLFYGGRFPRNTFLGYIRNFDASHDYFVRSADDGLLSLEQSVVKIR